MNTAFYSNLCNDLTVEGKAVKYGEALRIQRELAGLNQVELAHRIGISQQNISRWERDEVLPNIDFCVKLADFYNITVDELIGRDK